MSPSVALSASEISSDATKQLKESNLKVQPLKKSGKLDEYKHFDVTTAIGTEFADAQLSDLLRDDELIRDLAITVSERGVVFFRAQDINVEQQKVLGQKLGELTGKPQTSGLHIHPVNNSGRKNKVNERGEINNDDEISVISSELTRKLSLQFEQAKLASDGWHSDITFEPVPADYSILKLHTIPETGGDTLWASGYDLYDRLSPPFKELVDKLNATYEQPGFIRSAKDNGFELHTEPRGAPENVGGDLTAVHPVIRTNPVTGWKSVFAVGHHVGYINGVSKRESNIILDYFLETLAHSHDFQVRFKWGKNDVAIWDNRSAYHTATFDYDGIRTGNRVVSLGEKPYFDPASKSKREWLVERAQVL